MSLTAEERAFLEGVKDYVAVECGLVGDEKEALRIAKQQNTETLEGAVCIVLSEAVNRLIGKVSVLPRLLALVERMDKENFTLSDTLKSVRDELISTSQLLGQSRSAHGEDLKYNDRLIAELAAEKRRADAAVKDLAAVIACGVCTHRNDEACFSTVYCCGFEWRGACTENTEGAEQDG